MWTYNYSQPDDELMHHGILGMKWGYRKANVARATHATKSVKTVGRAPVKGPLKVNIQLFSQKFNSSKVIRLSKKGYAHVMSEVATNITNAQRAQSTIVKNIGKYRYTFRNNFDNTFDITDRKLIPGANTKRSKK